VQKINRMLLKHVHGTWMVIKQNKDQNSG